MPSLPPFRAWSSAALVVAGLLALPVGVVLSGFAADSDSTWEHLRQTVLASYLSNTITLLLGVGVCSVVIGVGAAWLVTMYAFPGRRLLAWALLLPLAMPTYLMAYTYTDLLQFSGPVQTWIRETFELARGEYWFPEVRSVAGAITVLSLVLYPYVYLLARAAFLEQSTCVLEVSRTLGCGQLRAFTSIGIPLARPAIATGAALVMMETLAEYGAVDYFAVDTFTTGIYRTWTSLDSPEAASQLASALVLFVFAVLALERLARRRARYASTTTRHRDLRRQELRGVPGILSTAVCSFPVLAGFFLPVGVLLHLLSSSSHTLQFSELFGLVSNTLLLALAAAIVILAVGLVVSYGIRLDGGKAVRFGARVVSIGYAVPGSVIAIGVLVILAELSEFLGVYLVGSTFALVYAYSVRFSSVSVQTLEAGLEKVSYSMDEAARTLGSSPRSLLRRVHVPLVRGSVLTASLLVFVEVMKELPATMLLRPFDFDTLAVRVHHYASDERLAQSSLPALLIVATGLVPVLLLSRAIDRSRAGAPSTP